MAREKTQTDQKKTSWHVLNAVVKASYKK